MKVEMFLSAVLLNSIENVWNYGARITQVYDTNGYLTGILRTSLAPVTMVYDKENREIASRQGESVVSYTYSGDGLKRSEIVPDLSTDPPGLSITTLVWDGSEYLAETE